MRAPIHRFERCGMEAICVPHMGHRLADVSVRSRPHCAHFVVESIRGDYSMVGDGEQLTEVTVSAGKDQAQQIPLPRADQFSRTTPASCFLTVL